MASPYIDLRTSGHHVPSLHPHRPIHDQRSSCLQPCHHSPLRIPAKLPESLPLGVAQMPDRIPGSPHRPSTEPLLGVAWLPDRTNDPNTDPWSARSAAPMRMHGNSCRNLARSPAHQRTRDYRNFARQHTALAPGTHGQWCSVTARNASGTCNAYPHICSIERPGCA